MKLVALSASCLSYSALKIQFEEQFSLIAVWWRFFNEREIVLWHTVPLYIISLTTLTCPLNAVFHVSTTQKIDEKQEELELCGIALQSPIHTTTQAVVLLSCKWAEGLMEESQCKVVEHWCPITARGLMIILPGKPFHVYIRRLMATLVNLSGFMKVPFPSISTVCIVHAGGNELYIGNERHYTHQSSLVAGKRRNDERCTSGARWMLKGWSKWA